MYNEPSLPPTYQPGHFLAPPRKEDRLCRCSEVDEYGRHCIGFCGPECEGRGEDRR